MTPNQFLHSKNMSIYSQVVLISTDGNKVTVSELLEAYRNINPEKKSPTLENILHASADYFGISETALLSKWENRNIVKPRWFIMYYMKKQGFTLKVISTFFKKHHSTLIYGNTQVEKLITNDPGKTQYENLVKYIKHTIG